MTGAPIYLVSACATGDEFVAAFRRYADKNGLFIPIAEPLHVGRRARFAVTLRDGGVMIEGHAEVTSSAWTASVVHGRVGMTLRFLEPDEASQTTLGELERARLAMKPPPPSIPPRPADIPAEPRPVPPPVQGRIDAVNALAQCVAVGDPDPPSPPPPPVSRARTKSLPPLAPIPTRSGSTTAPADGGLGVAPASPSPARFGPPVTPTEHGVGVAPRGPRSPTMPRATTPPPPAPSPRATPQGDALRQSADAATASVPSGPTSDTFVAVVPPAPPAPPAPTSTGSSPPRYAAEMPVVSRVATLTGTAPPPVPAPPSLLPSIEAPLPPPLAPIAATPAEPGPIADGPISETLTAVPIPAASHGSAPTEVGGILVEPLPWSDPAIAIPSAEASDDASAHMQIEGGAHAIAPAPPIVAAPRSALLEIEIAEPTDISLSPPEPVGDLAPRETREMPPPQTIELPAPDAIEAASDAASDPAIEPFGDAADPSTLDEVLPPRRTALGFAAVPAPAAAESGPEETSSAQITAVMAAEEPTPTPSETWRPLDDSSWPGAVETEPPRTDPEPPRETVSMRTPRAAASGFPREGSDEAPTLGDATPADPLPSSHTLPPRAPDGALLQPTFGTPGAPGALPTGDWTIARDPSAPDGWSEPFQTVTPPPHPDGTGMALAALGANARPLDGEPRSTTLRGHEMALEPKVQIDPTLIEPIPVQPIPAAGASPMLSGVIAGAPPSPPVAPDLRLRPMPSDGALQAMPLDNPFADSVVSSPGMGERSAPPGAIEAPPMNMMMAVAQSSPFLPQHGAQPGPVYAGADYPMATPHPRRGQDYPMVAMAGDPRYASEVALPVQRGQRRVIIVLVSALVAALVGIAVLLATGDSPGSAAPGSAAPSGSGVRPPGHSSVAPAPAPAPPAAVDSSSPSPDGTSATSAAPAPPAAAAAAAPPTTGECYADVTSAPAGAEIVNEQGRVIGTTPQKVALPCRKPIDLVVRKGKLASVTRTVTPTPEGTKLRVTLGRPTFLVKVSSTPPGATITLNGRSLGVTPTTVKVPAGESSVLMIVKDGFATETETVAPKANGSTVHADLKRLDRAERKKPW